MLILSRPRRGTLDGAIPFNKHGHGCFVEYPEGVVDFDFGPAGQTDGFDGWRLYFFAREHGLDHGYVSHREVDAGLAEAATARDLLRYPESHLYHLRVR